MHFTARNIVQRLEFIRRLIHHIQNVFRPFSKKHSLVRQAETGAASAEKLFSKLLLQILHLLG